MHSTIKTEHNGSISAFTPDNHLVMNYGSPYVSWGFTVDKLEQWLTTIEEIVNVVPPAHRYALESLYFSLKAAHQRHQKEHEEVVTEAPTSDDLMSYLTAYSAAMAWEAVEGRK
jgi:aminopeptidase-like protein